MTTANAINLSRLAAIHATANRARHLDRVAVMALGVLFYGVVMIYLLVGSAAIWPEPRA